MNLTESELAEIYRGYIACLNDQDWPRLGQFVAHDVLHNGRPLGLAGYREMLQRDHVAIPDLKFNVELITCDPPNVACRLVFDCTPTGEFMDLPVNGTRVQFAEQVFYEFREGRIAEVWSSIDRTTIAAQL